jgi:hypothetical protein
MTPFPAKNRSFFPSCGNNSKGYEREKTAFKGKRSTSPMSQSNLSRVKQQSTSFYDLKQFYELNESSYAIMENNSIIE